MFQRTPRNYNGTATTSKKISDLLPEVLADFSIEGNGGQEAISIEWRRLLGEKVACLTDVVSWVDGVFTVKVKSATLYSLLCQHEKPRLFKELKKKFPIRKIIFRIG